MNLMLINVSTQKIRRAVRLPEGDIPAPAGAGVSKSAASRHFVALSAARMKDWMGADLSALEIMVVQIDGIHIAEHLVLVAAIGIDGEGVKHPLGLTEGRRGNWHPCASPEGIGRARLFVLLLKKFGQPGLTPDERMEYLALTAAYPRRPDPADPLALPSSVSAPWRTARSTGSTRYCGSTCRPPSAAAHRVSCAGVIFLQACPARC